MILLHSLIIYKPARSHDYSHAVARRPCASWDRSARTCAALRAIAADHPAHESLQDVIRGTVDSLVKLVDALAGAGIELIGEGATSGGGGRGVRLKSPNGGRPTSP